MGIFAPKQLSKINFKLFFNGDKRNQTKADNVDGATLLRFKNRQTKPPTLSLPR